MLLNSKDHTAAVLENVRKGIESKVFDRKLNYLHEKKLALKRASRKKEFLIHDYNEQYNNYENYNDTLNSQNNHAKSLTHFMAEPLGLKEELGINVVMNPTNKLIEYEKSKNLIANKRIDSILK